MYLVIIGLHKENPIRLMAESIQGKPISWPIFVFPAGEPESRKETIRKQNAGIGIERGKRGNYGRRRKP